MLAFHGKQEIKDKYVARVKAHESADEIAQGYYWEKGKGCAVGCTIHGRDHHSYEVELGIPTAIALLEDRIFEGLPNDIAKGFPLRFLEAIPVAADLSMLVPKMMLWLLIDENHGVIKHGSEKGKLAIQSVSDLYIRKIAGETVTVSEWLIARKSAAADAAAAYAATYDAAATYAAAATAAATAATYDAATAATYDAATADAAAAYAATADAAAADDARKSHFIAQADYLIILLSQCN